MREGDRGAQCVWVCGQVCVCVLTMKPVLISATVVSCPCGCLIQLMRGAIRGHMRRGVYFCRYFTIVVVRHDVSTTAPHFSQKRKEIERKEGSAGVERAGRHGWDDVR